MLKTNRRFGMEFEFSVPWNELDKVAKKIISKYYGRGFYISKDDKYSIYKPEEMKKWHIKRENDRVGEINTPASRLKDLDKICKVIGALAKKKIKIDISDCGFHIHMEVKDIDKFVLMGWWLHCERAILECFPLERRKITSVEKLIREKKDNNKYVAELLESATESASHGDIISLRDYDDRHTIEFRVAEGTTDTNLIKYWTRFLLYWLEHAKTLHPTLVACKHCNRIKMEDLLSLIDADSETVDYMMWRYKKYHNLPYWVN